VTPRKIIGLSVGPAGDYVELAAARALSAKGR
jgi:hypothetical protein